MICPRTRQTFANNSPSVTSSATASFSKTTRLTLRAPRSQSLRHVEETIEVPVRVSRWGFFTRPAVESRTITIEITEAAYRSETNKAFNPWLLPPMFLVGLACIYAEKWIVQLCWRWFG